jgi:DNA helicase-2/ATP-dependent DNA helicase PcrA
LKNPFNGKGFVAKTIQFNSYQQKVVDFRQGYGVVVAAPGSGKTAVIVARIKALLAEGVPPHEILSMTFTASGAKEMLSRAGLKDLEIKRNGLRHKLFTTFHSWALAFIKEEAKALPFKVHLDWHGQPAPLCLPLDAARTLAQICKRIPNVEWKDASSYISLMKRRGLSPTAAMQKVEHDKERGYALAYRKYDEALRQKGLLDFDSIVIEASQLLKRRADIRERWQYRWVQVDESQDTDLQQLSCVQALTEQHGNCLFVGDPNQNMYSWRGSTDNLTGVLEQTFPTIVEFPLSVNYRSTQKIVDYCKEIAPIRNQTIELLTTPHAGGAEPEFHLYNMEEEEATAIINSCSDPSSTAILTRTNRQLAVFEDVLTSRNIRYRLLSGAGFWVQNEVKDAVAILGSVVIPSDGNILRMLTARCDVTKYLRKTDSRDHPSTVSMLKKFQECNPDLETGQPVLLHRLLPRFACGESGQEEIIHNIGYILRDLRQETSAMSGGAAMQRIVDRFGLLSFYDVAAEDDEDRKNFDNDPRDNIQKLLEYAGRYNTLSKYHEYTQRARKATLARTKCLTLSTVHSSKGLEWNSVFLAGVNDQMFPHYRGDPDEERRIYFVGCSRAAQRLSVSANGIPSEFIREKLAPEPTASIPDPWEGFRLQA